MSELSIGDKAPDFHLPVDGDNLISLSDFKGSYIILYFYPKDDTPGCTAEACGFNDALSAFKKVDAVILGVSKDTVAKHEKFKKKYDLKFNLVSDEDGTLCEAYGTWVEKSMYGKKYMGIDRATFLIDTNGKIAGIWRKVKVPGHVEEVKKALNDLHKKAA
ncbi:MAG: thioredoxin-dependent thiol peroxidase [Alphaproteobacteria bacterium]|nr:thioredoxin-dependent thiol peroxidase [Alphaproteobacteria bacterium]